MEITRETDYAMRCVLYLSGREGEIAMIDEISREMSVPRSFMAKILQKLTRAEIVRSFRGVKGGFQLAKDASQISLLDIIEVIQGPVAMNRCAVDATVCRHSSTCCIHPVWVELRGVVEDHLRKTNFSELSSSSIQTRKRIR